MKRKIKKYFYNLYLAETDFAFLNRVSNFLYTIYKSIIFRYECIQRSIFWAKKMHRSYDFDAHTIYEMIYCKLDRLEKCMSKHGNCVWNSCPESEEYDLMIRLRRARDLAKNLHEENSNDYLPELTEAHDKKWGELELKFVSKDNDDKTFYSISSYRSKVLTDEDIVQEKIEINKIHEKQIKAYLNDVDELFELLKNNVDRWWD